MACKMIFYPRPAARIFSLDGAKIALIGAFYGADEKMPLSITSAMLRQGKLLPRNNLKSVLQNISGNFCFVIEDCEGHIFAAADKIRSYPLLYGLRGDVLIIGNDSEAMRKIIPSGKNVLSFLEFKMAGYVTGRDTLFQGISQLQAGEFLFFDGRSLLVEDYYLFYNEFSLDLKEEELRERLHNTTRDIFVRLIERLRGRPVWIPLSAGLDSRLVLCMLKSLGYDAIQTFSYGVPGNHEARWAQEISKRVGVPWFFVPYTRSAGKRIFSSSLYRDYTPFGSGLVTIPFILDFPALCLLQQSQRIPDEVVFINGQTGDFISGNHIPSNFAKPMLSKEEMLAGIIKKHYSLWLHFHVEENLVPIKRKIESVVPLPLPDTMNQEYAVKWYELWEWRGRQTKYVINGQRTYDFFGLAWELPLWDDEYLEFWSQVPAEYKIGQRLYRDYLAAYDFFGVFRNLKFSRYISPPSMRYLQGLLAKFGGRGVRCAKTWLSYWQDYSYYYALYPYRAYLRDAPHHRSAVSYHVKYVLEHDYGESI